MTSRALQNKPELWIEEDRRLFFAETITIKATGECLNIEDKLAKIHTYMVDQYNSYREKGQSFYEDQRDIATKCKCTPKTLGKWIKVLQALGLLVIDESQKSHSYTVRSVVSQEDNLIFSYPKLLNGKPSYDHEEALNRLHTSQKRQSGVRKYGKSESKGQYPAAVVESIKADTRESAPIQQPVDHRVDAVSVNDAMRVEEDPHFFEQAQDQRKLPQGTKRRLPKSFSQTKVEAEDDDYSYEMAEAEEFHRQKYQRENYH